MPWKYDAAEVNRTKRPDILTKGEKNPKHGIRMDNGVERSLLKGGSRGGKYGEMEEGSCQAGRPPN